MMLRSCPSMRAGCAGRSATTLRTSALMQRPRCQRFKMYCTASAAASPEPALEGPDVKSAGMPEAPAPPVPGAKRKTAKTPTTRRKKTDALIEDAIQAKDTGDAPSAKSKATALEMLSHLLPPIVELQGRLGCWFDKDSTAKQQFPTTAQQQLDTLSRIEGHLVAMAERAEQDRLERQRQHNELIGALLQVAQRPAVGQATASTAAPSAAEGGQPAAASAEPSATPKAEAPAPVVETEVLPPAAAAAPSAAEGCHPPAASADPPSPLEAAAPAAKPKRRASTRKKAAEAEQPLPAVEGEVLPPAAAAEETVAAAAEGAAAEGVKAAPKKRASRSKAAATKTVGTGLVATASRKAKAPQPAPGQEEQGEGEAVPVVEAEVIEPGADGGPVNSSSSSAAAKGQQSGGAADGRAASGRTGRRVQSTMHTFFNGNVTIQNSNVWLGGKINVEPMNRAAARAAQEAGEEMRKAGDKLRQALSRKELGDGQDTHYLDGN